MRLLMHPARPMVVVILAGLMICPGILRGQDLPATQVWLAPIQEDRPGEPFMISAATGYNNQPQFSPDSQAVFFTAEQPDGQTDVWRYDMASRTRSAVNQSTESEYSPTPIPGRDAVSVIRVEADQRQRLWEIRLEDGQASLLMPNVEPVGYHAWMDEKTAVLFILGEPMSLHRATIGDQPSTLLASNIGRTLLRHPLERAALFVDKNPKTWRIAAIDPNGDEPTAIMPLFPGVEDFTVDDRGRFWAGSGSRLYRSDAEHTRWNLLVDLEDYPVENITRLAVSPDGAWLAMVSSP